MNGVVADFESHHVAKDGSRLWEKRLDMLHRDHGVGRGTVMMNMGGEGDKM